MPACRHTRQRRRPGLVADCRDAERTRLQAERLQQEGILQSSWTESWAMLGR